MYKETMKARLQRERTNLTSSESVHTKTKKAGAGSHKAGGGGGERRRGAGGSKGEGGAMAEGEVKSQWVTAMT